jgi:hypothetical protein
MAAQHILVTRPGLIDHGQRGGHFTVLPVFGVPLQSDRHPEEEHVRAGGAALAEAGLHAPVGLFVGLCKPHLGIDGIDLCADDQQIRMLLELFVRNIPLKGRALPRWRPKEGGVLPRQPRPSGQATVPHCGTVGQAH